MRTTFTGNMDDKDSLYLPLMTDEDLTRWFDVSNNRKPLTPANFNGMASSSNHTYNGTLPAGYNWYPYDPAMCPPLLFLILQRFCAPFTIVISTVLNSLIAIVLLQKHLRSPTNILLLAMALYDTLTGLFPFPVFIYEFTFRHCDDYMPYNYGWFHHINYGVLPVIFHTCSIWVTVVLAIQRYIHVCHSEKAKRWCTVSMTLKAIVTVNLLAVIVVAPMFVEGSFDSQVVPTKKDPKKLILACIVYDYSKDPRFKMPYSIYFLLRALLINIGPCTILVILNVILVKRMKEAKENRDRLIKKRQHETRGQEQTSVTLMLIIVVTIFLIVEVPIAMHLIIYSLWKLIDPQSNTPVLDVSAQLLNFAVIFSYPINFFIYCRMSRAFRDAFTKLLCPSWSSSPDGTIPSTRAPPPSKHHNATTNDNHFELRYSQVDPKSATMNVPRPSTVISNAATVDKPMLLAPPSPASRPADTSRQTNTSYISPDDDAYRSTTNTRSTDL